MMYMSRKCPRYDVEMKKFLLESPVYKERRKKNDRIIEKVINGTGIGDTMMEIALALDTIDVMVWKMERNLFFISFNL